VVYRETIAKASPEVEGKSPNKHNKFYMIIEPLQQEICDAIKEGKIRQGSVKKKEYDKLLRDINIDKKEIKGFTHVYGTNVLLNMVKGEVHIGEVLELIKEGFDSVMKKGPITNEKCAGIKVKLMDTKLHEDAIHRGPAQVLPAVRTAIKAAILMAGDYLLEPKQNIYIRVPEDYMGAVNREMQSRRGQILDMQPEGDQMEITAKAPVAELFGFAGEIRSATEGRVLWSTENAGFEKLPQDLQPKIIKEIRQRKGLKEQLPTPQELLG